MSNLGFGIDIGGSGIKGAIVDLDTGEFDSDRIKIATPQPATPEAVAEVVAMIVEKLEWTGAVGITVPATVRKQVARTAANIDNAWIGADLRALFSKHLGHENFVVLNDADAAGLAEVRYGDPLCASGSVLFLTLGTGIGSALLLDGKLFPNTELGHVEVNGKSAEKSAASSVKDRKEWSYERWAKELTKVLRTYEFLFNPDVFVVGGGISRKFKKWGPLLEIETPIVAAHLRNTAGIVGAALAAQQGLAP